jgi:hypothetical protein
MICRDMAQADAAIEEILVTAHLGRRERRL